MRLILTINLLILLLISSCRPSGEKKEAIQEVPPAGSMAGESYPTVPDSLMQKLWERCDYIDFIFYQLNFSLSPDQKTDIQKSVEHIAASAPAIQAACKPVGRVFYQIEGENVLEGDIYFSPECQYFIFYRDGKKVYANAMTPQSIQFYERVFSMVNQ